MGITKLRLTRNCDRCLILGFRRSGFAGCEGRSLFEFGGRRSGLWV
ncbi:MAG: hypothetical protein ACK5BG_00405 [Pseudanabaena sp.]